jgi:hypothetical protein
MLRASSCATEDMIVIKSSPLLSKVQIFSFSKKNIDSHLFELADYGKQVDGVTGEAGDGLDQDQVDLPPFAFLEHLLELGRLSARVPLVPSSA